MWGLDQGSAVVLSREGRHGKLQRTSIVGAVAWVCWGWGMGSRLPVVFRSSVPCTLDSRQGDTDTVRGWGFRNAQELSSYWLTIRKILSLRPRWGCTDGLPQTYRLWVVNTVDPFTKCEPWKHAGLADMLLYLHIKGESIDWDGFGAGCLTRWALLTRTVARFLESSLLEQFRC